MLYLKKIEMYGFKSFADKIELKFDQPITAIVGPNGCGKSNVSDAIRWVLGEQSSKNLRGKNMMDLIFGGTDKRTSMSYCEVSLFIDNTTRIFPLQLDEIIISRKLYRDGDSGYLLNRSSVRLKDITDLLRGVGLGKEGYSIVGQGRMDAVLNARPEDRRAIFEEALGISRFRVKRVETERKLEKTRANMDNLNVLSKELERQITPLRRQSTTARKYLELHDKLRYNEINAYIYGYDNASKDKENGRKKVTGLKEEYDFKETEYARVNEQYDELFHRINNTDGELSRLRDDQVTLAVEIQKQTGDKNLVLERLKNCRNEMSAVERDIETYESEVSETEKRISENQELLSKHRAEALSAENELAAVTDKFSGVSAKCSEYSRETEETRRQLELTLRQISECSSKQASFVTETETLLSRLKQIEKQEKELSERIAEKSDEEGALVGDYENAKKEAEITEEKLRLLRAKIKEAEFDLFRAGKELTEKQKAAASESGGISLLKDFAENYKGYQSSVQNLLNDAKVNPELDQRISGVVANTINVPQGLYEAVEAALGNRLQNVICTDETDAKYLIDYLKKNSYGKVTFLPVSTMRPHGVEHSEVLKESGILGIAKDLVSYDKRFESVFASLLGGIIVADTYETAMALSRKYRFCHRFVTLGGERVMNDGSVEGGGNKKGTGLLTYEAELREKLAKLEMLKAAVATAENNKKEIEDFLSAQRKLYDELEQELQNVSIETATYRQKIESSGVIGKSDKRAILGLSAEKEEITAHLNEIKVFGEQAIERMKALNADEARYKETARKLGELSFVKNSEKETLSEEISSKKLKLAMLKSNADTLEKSVNADMLSSARAQENANTKKVYLSQLKAAAEILKSQSEDTTDGGKAHSDMDELLEKIRSIDTLKTELGENFAEVGSERMRLAGELENLRGQIDKEEYILNKIDDDLTELQERVLTEYGVTYSAAMLMKDESYNPSDSRSVINELKISIQNLGYVNVNAITELEEIETRFNEIETQLDDLRKAENDLNDILKQLTDEIEVRFDAGMKEINDNFKEVFRELFNGGNAKLTVDKEEGKNSLDYGVEIEAQPPGKKLQNISLLSGGERTLIAAAILFAILKLYPMPFCVLDEIEAALDDSNADRIAKYLRKFADSTQFIVITHKKPTMENADVLYGVTMEEKGVSKIVAVKLTEAVKQAV